MHDLTTHHPPLDPAKMHEILTEAVRRVCPPWLAARREDIVQAALVKVLRLTDRGEESAPRTASYLWKVAFSVTMNELRAVRRAREVAVDEGMLDAQPSEPGTDPHDAAVSSALESATADCLAGLVAPRRLAVRLHLWGFGLKESAAILGWSGKRIDNLRYRGLSDLRACLQAKGWGR